MATSSDTVQFIIDQIGLGARLSSKKMFGEYALYLDEKVVAFVCDDQLYLKPNDPAEAYLGKVKLAPPYPGAKNYYLLTDELDDPDRLKEAVLITAHALPEPRPKAPKAPKAKKVGRKRKT